MSSLSYLVKVCVVSFMDSLSLSPFPSQVLRQMLMLDNCVCFYMCVFFLSSGSGGSGRLSNHVLVSRTTAPMYFPKHFNQWCEISCSPTFSFSTQIHWVGFERKIPIILKILYRRVLLSIERKEASCKKGYKQSGFHKTFQVSMLGSYFYTIPARVKLNGK